MKKSLKELQLDLIEIKAYRENQDYKDKEYYTNWWVYYVDQNEKDDNTSEDAYFRISQQNLEEAIEWFDVNNPKSIKNKNKPRLNQYERKKITQQKLQKIKDICSYYVVSERDGYLERNYLTNHSNKYSRTVYYKKYSNIKVRRNKEFKLKGNSYRKVFDYWWQIC